MSASELEALTGESQRKLRATQARLALQKTAHRMTELVAERRWSEAVVMHDRFVKQLDQFIIDAPKGIDFDKINEETAAMFSKSKE